MNETSERSYRDLPISERIQLVEDIWDSIADETAGGLPLSAAQRAELHRRRAEHEADPSSAEPWEQVRAELFTDKR
jgi:putative addiction module component (TIGR02574 family)